MEYKVVHNKEKGRFEVEINGLISEVDYILSGNTMVVTHTGVPKELEGQGIAAAMNKALLEYADESGFKVKPLCSYTAAYIMRHPEYENLVEK